MIEPMISGSPVVKPFSTNAYVIKNIAGGGRWSVSDTSKARIKTETSNNGIILEIITGKSGNVTLVYELDDYRVELLIKILSL